VKRGVRGSKWAGGTWPPTKTFSWKFVEWPDVSRLNKDKRREGMKKREKAQKHDNSGKETKITGEDTNTEDASGRVAYGGGEQEAEGREQADHPEPSGKLGSRCETDNKASKNYPKWQGAVRRGKGGARRSESERVA